MATLVANGIAICVERKELARALRWVLPAAPKKSKLPVLCNVLLETGDGTLALTTHNLSLSLRTEIPAEVRSEGKLTLPAHLLSRLVSAALGDQVQLQPTDDPTRVRISCGAHEATMYGIDAADFCAPPAVDAAAEGAITWQLPADRLGWAIGETSFAAAREDTRPVLSGLLLWVHDGQLTGAAADGFRLAVSDQPLDEPQTEGRCLLPAADLQELARKLPSSPAPVVVTVLPMSLTQSSAVRFDWGAGQVTIRQIFGEFPNYERIIPQSTGCQVVAPLAELRSAVRLASLWSDADSQATRLEMDPEHLQVQGRNSITGEGGSAVPVVVKGDPIEITFNGRLLDEWLEKVAAGQVAMGFTTPQGPGLFSLVGRASPRYVVMPMQVGRR